MKIVFNDKQGKDIGSTRIFIHNIFDWFLELKYDVVLNDWDNYSKYDVAIFGKNADVESIQKAKHQNPGLICGIVNPSDYFGEKKQLLTESDFFITGSILEKDYYLRYNDNVFVFPLIEKIFDGSKKHENHSPIVIGYHGNLEHLNNFSISIKNALETLASRIPIKFIAIYDKNRLGLWKKRRPNIDIEDIQWDIDKIQDDLLRCDIGIVPGLIPLNTKIQRILFNIIKIIHGTNNSNKNDYLIRFKNTTNAGRAFVFHQLGIPVISDFLPTSFHILDNFKCGYLAYSEKGWLSAFEKLSQSADYRQEIAKNALEEFNRLYNPMEFSERLYKDIEKLWQKIKK